MLDCSKIDELMMDWLYQELDESSSARVAEHVQGCARCSAEASALQRTREAFRELSPVEPPVAVSAILLHEAARRAPAVAAAPARGSEEGFWARVRSWFRPIAMHPAAAAIATLVLVAGVAGTLYVRHGDQMTDTPDLRQATTSEPVVASETPKPEEPAAPALDMPTAPPAQGAHAAASAESEDEQSARADRDGYSADVLGSEQQRELSKATAKLERAPADTGKPYSIEKKPAPTSRKKAAKPSESKGPIANVVSGADPLIEGEMDLKGGIGSSTATRGRAADKMQQAAQPPAAPPSSTSSTTPNAAPGAIDFSDGTGNGDSGGYRVYKQKPMTAAELKASEGKLGAAVKKKDCLSAARIANDILDRNGEYAYKRVASQSKPCQMYVSQERARRASKNVGSGKNVAAPAKAKAAPQKDEAAETAE